MDFNIQIQTLKSQIENMKLQIDNISMQNNNMLMMNTPIGGQLINLSMQMLNTGIQTFNIGKTMMMNMSIATYYEQLEKVSEQINNMINEYNMQQQMMMQQQIMMQQQMIMQQQINDDRQIPRINITFTTSSGIKTVIPAKYGTKVKDVLKQYIEKNYGFQNDKELLFLFNGSKINQNELKVVENYFINDIVDISVLEI